MERLFFLVAIGDPPSASDVPRGRCSQRRKPVFFFFFFFSRRGYANFLFPLFLGDLAVGRSPSGGAFPRRGGDVRGVEGPGGGFPFSFPTSDSGGSLFISPSISICLEAAFISTVPRLIFFSSRPRMPPRRRDRSAQDSSLSRPTLGRAVRQFAASSLGGVFSFFREGGECFPCVLAGTSENEESPFFRKLSRNGVFSFVYGACERTSSSFFF